MATQARDIIHRSGSEYWWAFTDPRRGWVNIHRYSPTLKWIIVLALRSITSTVGVFPGCFAAKRPQVITIINEEHQKLTHASLTLSSGCIIMSALWPITRLDRSETGNDQSQASVHIYAKQLGVWTRNLRWFAEGLSRCLVRMRRRLFEIESTSKYILQQVLLVHPI